MKSLTADFKTWSDSQATCKAMARCKYRLRVDPLVCRRPVMPRHLSKIPASPTKSGMFSSDRDFSQADSSSSLVNGEMRLSFPVATDL